MPRSEEEIKKMFRRQFSVCLPEGETQVREELFSRNAVVDYLEKQRDLRQDLFETRDLKKRMDIYQELLR